MNGDPQKRKVLYEALTKDGYALGTLDEFSSKMDDPNKAKALYDGITKDGYEVGDFETFNAKVGSPKPAALSSMTTPLSGAAAGPSIGSGMQQAASQEPPQAQQPPSVQVSQQAAPDLPESVQPIRLDEAGDQVVDVPAEFLTKSRQQEAWRTALNAPDKASRDAAHAQIRADREVRAKMDRVLAQKQEDRRLVDEQVSRDLQFSLPPQEVPSGLPEGQGPATTTLDPREQKVRADYMKSLTPEQQAYRASKKESGQWADRDAFDEDVSSLTHAMNVLDARERRLLRKSEFRKAQQQTDAAGDVMFQDNNDVMAEAQDIDLGRKYVIERLQSAVRRHPEYASEELARKAKTLQADAGAMINPQAYNVVQPIRFAIDKFAASLLTTPRSFGSAEYGATDQLAEWAERSMENIRADEPTKFRGNILDDGGVNPERILPKVVETIGQAALLVGTSPTRPALLASAFIQSNGDYFKQARDSGLSNDEAKKFAWSAAALNSALELASPNDAARQLVGGALRKEIATGLEQGLTTKEILGRAAKVGAKEALPEMAQEGGQYVGDKGAAYLANRILGGDRLDDHVKFSEFTENALLGGVVGGLAGGVPEAMRLASISETAKNPQKVAEAAAAMGNEQAKEKVQRIVSAYEGNGLSNAPPQKAAVAADAIIRKNDIEQAIKKAPMDPALEAAIGDPRKTQAAELTTAMIEAMDIPADKAKAALIGAGMEKAPEGTKAITNPDGSVTLEKKPETGGAKAATATASAQPAKKQPTSKAVESVFSADEATGEEETPAAPTGVPEGVVPVSTEATIPEDVLAVYDTDKAGWSDVNHLRDDVLDDLRHDWLKDIERLAAGKETTLQEEDVRQAARAIAAVEQRIQQLTNEDQLTPEAPAAAQAEDTGAAPGIPAPEQPTPSKSALKREAEAQQKTIVDRANNTPASQLGVRGAVLRYFAAGGKVDRLSAMKETGMSHNDMQGKKWVWMRPKGKFGKEQYPSVEMAAHKIMEDSGGELDDTEVRDAVIDVLLGTRTKGALVDELAGSIPENSDNYLAQQERIYMERIAPIEDAAEMVGVEMEDADVMYAEAEAEWDAMTPEQKQATFDELDAAQAADPDQAPVQGEAGDSVPRGQEGQDAEAERLAAEAKRARAERDRFVADWNERGQGLFAPEEGMAQQTIDGGFDNSQENFDTKVEPLNEKVRQADKALADYVNSAASRAQAAAQQTSIGQAPAQAEAPLPEKEAEPVATVTEVTRDNPDPKKATQVEYKIPGWENYITVVRKRPGGWAMYILKDGNDFEIHGKGKEEPTPSIAASTGADRLNGNRGKVEQMLNGTNEQGSPVKKSFGRIPVSPIVGDVRNRSDVLKDLSKGIERRIAFAKPGRKGMAGTYAPSSAGVKVKYAGDLDTTAHEIGHALDDAFGLTTEAMNDIVASNELNKLAAFGSAAPKGHKSPQKYLAAEGVAEYIRACVVNPEQAKQDYPAITALYDKLLSKEAKDAISKFSDDVRAFAGATGADMVMSNVDFDPSKSKSTALKEIFKSGDGPNMSFADKLNANWVNPLTAFSKAIRYAKDIQSIPELDPAKDPYLLARLYLHNGGKTSEVLESGMINSRNEVIKDADGNAKTLNWLLAPLDNTTEKTVEQDVKDVIAYTIAERTVELGGRFKREDILTGIGAGLFSDMDVAQKVLDEMAQDPAKLARIQEGARRYREMATHTLEYLRDKGRLSEEQFNKIKKDNLQYVALQRVMEAGPNEPVEVFKGASGKLASVGKPVKSIYGSSRKILNPYVALIDSINKSIKEADRNEVLKTFTDLLRSDREMHDGEPVPLSDVGTIGQQGDKNSITVFNQGKPEHWNFAPDVHAALKGLDDEGYKLPSIVRLPASVLRWTVTHFPVFAARNIARDLQSRLILSTEGSGFKDLRGDHEHWNEVARAGGLNAGFYVKDDAHYYGLLNEAMSDIAKNKKFILADPTRLKHVWHAYENALYNSETVNRVAEYRAAFRKAKEKGMDDYNAQLYAAFRSSDLIDFALAGHHARVMNQVVPFSNAMIQGLRSAVVSAKKDPKGFIARTALYGILPSVIVWMLAHSNDDDEEEYESLPAYQRDMFYNIKVGDNKWLVIPKPFELSLPGAAVDRMLSAAAGKKDAFDGYAGSVLKSFLPDESAIAGPGKIATELMTNYDFFKDKAIVPSYENNLKLKLRDTEAASRAGKVLQNAVGWGDGKIDARKWDHFIQSQFSYFGKTALKLSDIGRDDSRNKFDLSDLGFFKGSPAYNSAVSMDVQKAASEYGLTSSSEYKAFKSASEAYFSAKGDKAKDVAAKALRKTAEQVLEQVRARGEAKESGGPGQQPQQPQRPQQRQRQ
jgi:hypothetical protein